MVSTSNTKFKYVKCQREEFHGLYECPEFINLSVNDRCEFIKRNNLCFNCLKFHAVRNCTSTFRCQKCSKKHSTLHHYEKEKQNRIERPEIGDSINSRSITASLSLNPNAMNFESSYERNIFSGAAVSGGEVRQTKTAILSTANIFVKDCFGNLKSARALLDVGSMCSYITEFADLLHIKKEKISIAVSGLNGAKINVSSRVCTVVSNKSDFEMQLEFLCVPKISSMIPIDSLQIPKEHFPLNIKLADPYFYRPGKIDVLLEQRLNKFAIISDIEKAFLQLTLVEKDRDAVRFLWTENDTLQVYRFNRVLFGVRSSPFLLSASIKTHLKKFHDEFPTTTECLNRCFYVDDFISRADSLQDALEISTQAVSIMDQASIVLRKWTTNSDELRQLWKRESLENQLQDNPISPRVNSIKVLGMLWNTVEDHLIMGTQSLVDSLSNNENTNRHLLRVIGKNFDPLGLLTPFTIRVKCILQVLWMKEIFGNEELPPDIQKAWYQWVSEVPRLSELQIPRYVLSSSTGEPTDVLELHCFCDGSQKAYGVVICTRVVKDCNVEVNLLVSKSRVAPQNQNHHAATRITRCIACRPTSK
ncbi:hypothetical protein AVEN_255662-1 [Araneus ventricosus]|uniref:Peptidase aspartic putative domain-containing protein n=1 Tax=Araneus ventricosus TaxID=182803 RepID=A0A4Y2H1Z7_ARAVE|nr:hypothetical protein AVEN_255662-1 [Araneus ventricosus]